MMDAERTSVVVGGSGFSAGVDSGSLIVSQNNASPTARLYAGSSTTTIGNPAQQVLSALGGIIGFPVSFVGTSRSTAVSCPATGGGGNPHGAAGAGPSQAEIDHATAIKERHASRLMADPAVMGVGVGAEEIRPAALRRVGCLLRASRAGNGWICWSALAGDFRTLLASKVGVEWAESCRNL